MDAAITRGVTSRAKSLRVGLKRGLLRGTDTHNLHHETKEWQHLTAVPSACGP